MQLTIFTPTFNRAHTLPRLYQSLKQQTSLNFEWIIVDDGSTDETKELVQSFISESILDITYKYVENGGKMRAINRGVSLAKGKFFFVVDSDDYLSEECVEKILFHSSSLPQKMGGLVFRKINLVEDKVENEFPEYSFDSFPIEVFYKRRILGDKAEVIRTQLLKMNAFPEIEGEKFVPEGLIWNRIGEEYGFRYINEPIYFFEYLPDGYTQNLKKCLKENPGGFYLYYRDILRYSLPFSNRVKFFLRLLQSLYYKSLKGGKC
jgi:glycosyltransferase involved in cell wall biosynthesis